MYVNKKNVLALTIDNPSKIDFYFSLLFVFSSKSFNQDVSIKIYLLNFGSTTFIFNPFNFPFINPTARWNYVKFNKSCVFCKLL